MSKEDKQPEQAKKPQITSLSEKIFNGLVYGGISFFGVFLATIPIAYKAKYGNWSPYFNQAKSWLKKQGFKESTAEQTVMTTALMQGGNLAVLPIKLAEDHKIEFVQAISQVIGEKIDLEELKKQDKQTWPSIIKARIVAWISVFSSLKAAESLIGKEQFNKFEHNFSEKICNLFNQKTHVNGQESKAFKYGKIAALDVFATAAATILLYFGSKFFASKNPENAEIEKIPTAKNADFSEDKPQNKQIKEILKSGKSANYSSSALSRKEREVQRQTSM